jgi:pyruvate,water dikinase
MNSAAIPLHHIRWFEEIGIKDVALVGGKNASLGELYRKLAPQGINVPNGFAITADAYWELVRSANLFERIKELLSGLDAHDTTELGRRDSQQCDSGKRIRRDLRWFFHRLQ